MFLELLNTLVLAKDEQDVRGVMEVFARKELFNALFASQRPHEGNDTGELQPHQGGGAADCRRRVAAHPVRPGTATPLAEQVRTPQAKKGKSLTRLDVQTVLRTSFYMIVGFLIFIAVLQ